MIIDHTDIVAAIKAQLLAKGKDLSGPCGSFAITSRVAWHPVVRAEGWGLIHKNPGQNGCTVLDERYAIDALMKPDGTVIDMLQKAESNEGDTSDPQAYNIPLWTQVSPQPPENWRAPFNVDSDDPDPEPEPQPEPEPGQLSELVRLIREAGTLLGEIKANQERSYTGVLFGYTITLKPVEKEKRQ